MEKSFRILILIFWVAINSISHSFASIVGENLNSNSLINLNKGMQAFGFRTQEQWTELSNLMLPYYSDRFNPGLFDDHPYVIYPYWQGNRYIDYFFDHITRVGYLGYMINPTTGSSLLTYSWTVNNMVEYAKETGIGCQVDLVLYCTGQNETDAFLSSDTAKANCISQVMKLAFYRDSFPTTDTIISKLYNADGINVFFPDFNFKKKREYSLFIKDLCWAYWQDKELAKRDSLELILTFPLCDTIHKDFVDGLYKYVDEVYYADFDYRGIIGDTSRTMYYRREFIKGHNNLNPIQKIVSEIRLAYFYNPLKKDSVKFNENWIPYFLAIILIFTIILATLITAAIWGKFNQLVTENRSIVFLVGLLLIIEAIFLFIFMVEKMNYTIWLINIDNPSSHYFLSLPLILIVLFPIIKLLSGSRQRP